MNSTSSTTLGLISLRTKAIAIAAIVAFIISGATASFTLLTVRTYITNQRSTTAVSQVAVLSRTVGKLLRDGINPVVAIEEISTSTNSIQVLLESKNVTITGKSGTDFSAIPEKLRLNAFIGQPGSQIYNSLGAPYLAVALPIEIEGFDPFIFIGVINLFELNRTVVVLSWMLALSVLIATSFGGAVGFWLSRRVSEPLRQIGDAALLISSGDLEIQVPEAKEPDLHRIGSSFNEMTASLRKRIDREARFGAVVSHELRSPLTAIRSASDHLHSHRSELSPQLAITVDLLSERVITFQKILDDLLEISKYESGTNQPNLEILEIKKVVESLLTRHNLSSSDYLSTTVDPNQTVLIDGKRFSYIFDNLLSNANLYGGGLRKVRIESGDDRIDIHFDDAGPGVSTDLSKIVFDPFVRGVQHSNISGSGLGLAIAQEHANKFHGAITVTTSPEGGARFTISMQVQEVSN